MPVTLAGFELSKQQGFYEKNPGADLPVLQLTRGTVTEQLARVCAWAGCPRSATSSRRRWRRRFQGGQTAQQAMDNAVDARQQGAAGVPEVGEGKVTR